MGKIKINLTSGNMVEKPLVTAFRNSSGEYLILDNEANGSMGLPIICISKINGEELQKVYDPSEWNQVKESLKSIIAGNSADYLNMKDSLNAQDDFYTQLSLPVQSFDLLKSAYTPKEEAPAPVETPDAKVEEISAPVDVPKESPAASASLTPDEPQVEEPVVLPQPEVNVSPVEVKVEPEKVPEQITPDPLPQEESAPVDINPTANSEEDVAKIKESFLKACENMFDALYNKFNK